MDYRSQAKSRQAAVTFARELHCLNGACAGLNITSHWQDNEIRIFVIRTHHKKIRSHDEISCAQVSS